MSHGFLFCGPWNLRGPIDGRQRVSESQIEYQIYIHIVQNWEVTFLWIYAYISDVLHVKENQWICRVITRDANVHGQGAYNHHSLLKRFSIEWMNDNNDKIIRFCRTLYEIILLQSNIAPPLCSVCFASQLGILVLLCGQTLQLSLLLFFSHFLLIFI